MLVVYWFHLREMKTRTLSEEERGVIVGMRSAGMSTYSIAKELEMSQSTVFTIWKNYCERGTVVARKPCGRAEKLSIRDKRDLARILTQNRHLSRRDIIEQMRVKVCKRTLSTYINKLGFSNRVAVRKPYLSKKHKLARLAFAKAHKRWTMSDWRNIMWTDESSFEIGKRSRQVKVWRRPYERYSMDCIAPTFKSGRTSVMIWGAFSGFDKCPIIVMPPYKRTSEDFVNIVYEGRLSGFYFMHDERENLILMEDGAPVHSSKYAESWRVAHI